MSDHGTWSGEIRRHAVVGACVVIALIVVELTAHRWAEFEKGEPFWKALGVASIALVVAFLIAFSSIAAVEFAWRKYQSRKPILIEGVESVSGVWIDAIVEGNVIMRAAKFTIRSTVATGFSIEGDSFKVSANAPAGLVVDQTRCGRFTSIEGTGVSLGSKSLAYSYAGHDSEEPPDARRHGGIVYYEFGKETARTIEGKETVVKYFNGAFLERGTLKVYQVFGMKLPDETLDSGVHAKMQEFVNRPDVQEFAKAGKPPLSIFPGVK